MTARRLLVVEDDPAIAMALEEDDLRAAKYSVVVKTDGIHALESARDRTFDAILLDIMLPRKDGLAVCRELRSAGVQTPIILLTAKALEADKILGLAGADDYITKPYSPGELRARLNAVLRRASDTLPDRFEFGECAIDFLRRELRRAGTVVPLTPLEFRLLETFIRHRGRALSRQRLIDDAWGMATFVTDRVIKQPVTDLRKRSTLPPQRQPSSSIFADSGIASMSDCLPDTTMTARGRNRDSRSLESCGRRSQMRIRHLVLAALVAGPVGIVAGQGQSPEVSFKAAQTRELVDGDWKGAAAMYLKVADEANTDRALAARALLAAGTLYQTLGTVEARGVFERIVREYGDQSAASATARTRLSALTPSTTKLRD